MFPGLIQRKTTCLGTAQVGVEGRKPVRLGSGCIGVFVRHVWKRAPAMATRTGRLRLGKPELVLLKIVRWVHGAGAIVTSLLCQTRRWWRATDVPGTVSEADSVNLPSSAKATLRTC